MDYLNMHSLYHHFLKISFLTIFYKIVNFNQKIKQKKLLKKNLQNNIGKISIKIIVFLFIRIMRINC